MEPPSAKAGLLNLNLIAPEVSIAGAWQAASRLTATTKTKQVSRMTVSLSFVTAQVCGLRQNVAAQGSLHFAPAGAGLQLE